MKYIQSYLGWKIYQLADGSYSSKKGRKYISGARTLGIIKQTIAQQKKRR